MKDFLNYKKVVIILFVLAGLTNAIQAQITLYSESFDSGNPTGWTISGGSATYSWSSASPSTNYQGASGNYNARNGTATTATLVFNNSLSTIGYTNLCVSWGAYRTSGNSLNFYWSTDGSNWNQTTFTDVSATSYWGLVTVTLPAGAENASNLQFKFISQSTAGTNRIDDFKVQSNAGTGNWSLTGNSNATSTGFLGTTNAQDLAFKTNNAERARILSNGNFGIGTNNPQAKLSIVGDAILNFSGNQFGDITSSTSIRPHFGNSSDFKIFKGTPGNSSEMFSIDNNGNISMAVNNGKVGIGTNKPSGKLGIVTPDGELNFYVNQPGDIQSSSSLRPHYASGDFSVYQGIVGTGTPRLVIGDNGNTILNPSGGSLFVSPFAGNGNKALYTNDSGRIFTVDPTTFSFWQGNSSIISPVNNPQVHIGTSTNYGSTNKLVVGGNVFADVYGGSGNQTAFSAYVKDGDLAFDIFNGTYPTRSLHISSNGNITIFTDNSNAYNLFEIKGTSNTTLFKIKSDGYVEALDVKVKTSIMPDYVFEKGYKRMALLDLEQYIKHNKHLPLMPSAKEFEKDGMSVADFNKNILETVEVQALYIIEMQKQLNELKAEFEAYKQQHK